MCVLVLVFFTGSVFAQQTINITNVDGNSGGGGGTYSEGVMLGEAHAKGEGLYFLWGCLAVPLTGMLGFILPVVIEPKVPVEMTIGKSADFIRGYRESYVSNAKRKNIMLTAGGCATSTGLGLISYLAFVGFAAFLSY
ncbi:MAG: hypothetical protein D6B26_03230 [Spirochaetaceae bacterium]|nr:MAG: hypothetical protein D6B26_03230 [Spirochaetaceae bacterium]